MPESLPARQCKHCRHFVERRIEGARPLAQRNDSSREFVDGDCRNRGDFSQSSPDVGEHDDHERRQIEQQDQPGVAQPIGKPHPAHQVSNRGAQCHRQREGERNARQCHAEMEEQVTRPGFCDHGREHGGGRWQLRVTGKQRADPPGCEENSE